MSDKRALKWLALVLWTAGMLAIGFAQGYKWHGSSTSPRNRPDSPISSAGWKAGDRIRIVGIDMAESHITDGVFSDVTELYGLIHGIYSDTGSMRFQATRQITFAGKTTHLYLTGVVYPKDVDPNGEVDWSMVMSREISVTSTEKADKGQAPESV